MSDEIRKPAAVVARILLADDHETVRHGLKLLIDSQPDMCVVGEAGTGPRALEQVRALRPDVVVLDLSMPGMSGVDVARAIDAAELHTAIVALTRHADDAYVQALLGAGARGYVLKQSASTELLAAIRATCSGSTHLDVALRETDSGLRLGRDAAPRAPRAISDRESEVLHLMARGYSNKEIASRLELSVKTIEVHKANAMRKLNLRGRVDVVRHAARHGWLDDA